jgi:hypothetical protein
MFARILRANVGILNLRPVNRVDYNGPTFAR